MISSVDDARRYLLNLLPPGAENLYDLSPTGDVYLLFDGLAELFKTYGFDVIARLKRELFPPFVQDKLPDWESATGIAFQEIALVGTVAQRQNAVVSKLRESGAFCDPVTQSILGPLLGYNPATPVQLIKADRSALRLLHSYGNVGDVALPASTTTSVSVSVTDGGRVSRAGASLELNFASGALTDYTITLTAPDGTTTDTWTTGWSATPVRLASEKFAGAQIFGEWVLSIHNGSGSTNTLYDGPWLFVEGILQGHDTGGAVFSWGVYADPAHVGESGTTPDFAALRRAIARIKHSYTVGSLIQSLAPWPDTDSGVNAAIPDECIPA